MTTTFQLGDLVYTCFTQPSGDLSGKTVFLPNYLPQKITGICATESLREDGETTKIEWYKLNYEMMETHRVFKTKEEMESFCKMLNKK